MIIWELLLSAAINTGIDILIRAGLEDKAEALRELLTKKKEKQRHASFERAFKKAREAAGEESINPLLEHRPFIEEVLTVLLDPEQPFDVQAAADVWKERLPAHARSLRRFFDALDNALLEDDIWGPLLQRFNEIRYRREVTEILQERKLAASARELIARISEQLPDGSATDDEEFVPVKPIGPLVEGDVVGDIVHNVIQQMNITIEQPPDVIPGPEKYRQRYLKELVSETRSLPWAVIDQEYADPAGGESVGLADVYTALDTTEFENIREEAELRTHLSRTEEAKRVSAQETVNREGRLLILGHPGSGKSTFVNYLTNVLARACLENRPEEWLKKQLDPWDHGAIQPLRIVLREFADRLGSVEEGRANLLLDFIESMLKEWKLDPFWTALDSAIREPETPMLILLDGLDEVPAGLRKIVVDTVNDFAARYSEHRYVVTCRPYAYIEQPYRLQRFHEVTLAPFDEEQINSFIDAWYNELSKHGQLSTRESRALAGRLQEAIRRRDLKGLAERPLLLTVMAMLHTGRRQLPEDRVELYAWTVDLLLRRWESRVSGKEGILKKLKMPELRMSDLEAALYSVAFNAHERSVEREGTADISEGDLIIWIGKHLGGKLDKAKEFVAYIRERSGLLVRHKTAAYTFPHRTFQEFLAACHLVGQPDFPHLAAALVREDPVRWKEVFQLSAGRAARLHMPSQAVAAVNALCPHNCEKVQDPVADDYRLASLAGESLLEIGLVGVQKYDDGRALLDRIRGTDGWLVDAIGATGVLEPKDRAAAGNVLAKLGDPRTGVDRQPDTGIPDIVWCLIPTGEFLMGSDKKNDPDADEDELYQHTLSLPEFYVSRYPVTNAQYKAFIDAGGYVERRFWPEAGEANVWQDGSVKGRYDDAPRHAPVIYSGASSLANHPTVGITWYEALAFCRWLEESMLKEGRKFAFNVWDKQKISEIRLPRGNWSVQLPSEAEWEKAARGERGSEYPWGDEAPDTDRANYDDTGIGETSPVGCFPAGESPYGILDMSGNTWEWTRTLLRNEKRIAFKYPYEKGDGRERLDAGNDIPRVLRGGSFGDESRGLRCASRFRSYPDFRFRFFGFRVVLSPV